MSATGLEVFDETLHKTNTWLKEIGQELSVDRHGAYQVLRAVLIETRLPPQSPENGNISKNRRRLSLI